MRSQVTLIAAIVIAVPLISLAEDPVFIPDATLKAAIEEQLGIQSPTPTDMLGLTYVAAESSDIVDLTGLETGTNIVNLFLGHNQISDLSPIAGLPKLDFVTIPSNQITDISPMWAPSNLTALDVRSNQISDLSLLLGPSNLTALRLNNNPLNTEAYCKFLPLILSNKPEMSLAFPPPPSA